MTRPAPRFRRMRLHIFGPDTTTGRGYIRAAGAEGKHSKAFSDSALTFTGNALEDVLAADQTLLEDAFVVPEVYYEATSSFLPIGTPYLLSPGSGSVIGSREGAAKEQNPVAVGALHGLLDECIVLPTEHDDENKTFRRAGGLEQNRYVDFTSKGYSESLHTWHDADIYDPTGQPKAAKPDDWPAAVSAAEWVFRDADEGGRTCLRFPTFTLTEDQRVVFVWSSDENGKLVVDGPNQGGAVIDWDADEDGYNQGFAHKTLRLKAGTYRTGGWFLSINSTGGDGNDSARVGAYSIKTDGTGDLDAVLFVSDADTRVLRQEVGDELPGMSVGETIRRLLEENSDAGVDAADILLANRTFTDSLDSDDNDWTHLRGWVWPLGTSLASALSDMLTDCDLDMSPDFAFNGYDDRGTDLSATVNLTPGATPATAAMNLTEYSWEADPAGPNAFLTSSQEGLGLYTPTVPTGQRRRLGQLESGSSSTIARAKRNAAAAVKANGGGARRFYHGTIIAVAGAVPYVDFGLCDVVHGRGYRNLGLDVEVTAMTWTQGDTTKVSLDLAEPTT